MSLFICHVARSRQAVRRIARNAYNVYGNKYFALLQEIIGRSSGIGNWGGELRYPHHSEQQHYDTLCYILDSYLYRQMNSAVRIPLCA